ncbi:MAG TPA: fluoride efflux transporter CrcB [Bacillales bacterium]|nr:fluoride efflux transporter CrcB [Bacillales bacterium]
MVYVSVGLFGVIGALLRYFLGLSIHHIWHQSFPLATLLANLIGCFLLGWITAYLSHLNKLYPYLMAGIGSGLIGSFTTFSTFSVETVKLIQASNWGTAILYVLISFWGGLWAAWMGYVFLAKKQERGSNG